MNGTVVLVDDERAVRDSVSQWLGLAGREVHAFADAPGALAAIGSRDFAGVVVTDLKMAGMDGMALLDAVLGLDADIPVVLVTGHGDVAGAVDAMRRGAYDFIEKPFRPERLLSTIDRALALRGLVLQNRALRGGAAGGATLEQRLLGDCAAMRRVRHDIRNLGPVDVDVLVVGETGTGKELVARALHDHGPRAAGPFRAVDCSAIPEGRAELELFGTAPDAVGPTGVAVHADTRAGRGPFELADGGTVLLDEICNMPAAQQVKLLRLLEAREVRPVGATEARPFDVRLVSAASDALDAALDAGAFRTDLYYRLNAIELHVPPLRDRDDDATLLFEHFARLAAAAFERALPDVTSADVTALRSHAWPGNVREARNLAERFVLYGDARVAALLSRPADVGDGARARSLAHQVQTFERAIIERALRRADGDVAAACEALGVPRRTLNDKLQRLGVDRDALSRS